MTLLLIHLYVQIQILLLPLIHFFDFRLTIKLPILTEHLSESKIIQSLLKTLNLSPDMVLQTIKYFLENPIEKQSSSKTQTNFAEID